MAATLFDSHGRHNVLRQSLTPPVAVAAHLAASQGLEPDFAQVAEEAGSEVRVAKFQVRAKSLLGPLGRPWWFGIGGLAVVVSGVWRGLVSDCPKVG